MERKIIGVAAKKRSGKDTLCGFLQAHHPFVRTAFAEPLWECLLATDPWINIDEYADPRYYRLSVLNQMYGYEGCKTKFPEVRRLMQRLGTEGIRTHIGQSTWLDIVEKKLKDNPFQSYLISDIRFDNEAALIQRLGGLVVKLERPGTESDEHISESIQGVYEDVLYVNSGTLDDLDKFARKLVEEY